MEQNNKKKSPVSPVILLVVLLAFACIFLLIRHANQAKTEPAAAQTQEETAQEQSAAVEEPSAAQPEATAEPGEILDNVEETQEPFTPLEVEEDTVIELGPDEDFIVH